MKHLYSYVVQTWKGEKLVSELPPLSYDAALEVCRAQAALSDFTTRMMSQGEDYCEVWSREGVRRGTHAETTLVLDP